MRKLWLISVACLVVLAAVMAVTAVAAGPKGDKVTITGEPVDLWCYMAAGAKGADHKACATACANSGLPIARHRRPISCC